MSFISGSFAVFIALLFAVYFALGHICPRFQWIALLAAGYVFYSCSSLKNVVFLFFTTITTWGAALLMENAAERYPASAVNKKRLILAICLCVNLGLLFLLKYINFILCSFGAARIESLIVPLGISFYTFQSLGYCIDIYRGITTAERNFFKYALFVSFFPQIGEGPIGRFDRLAPQLYVPHTFNYARFTEGLSRIVIGVFKKVFVADTLASFVNVVYSSVESYSGAVLCIAAVFYTFQIYADFSGYIDIALGCAQSLGITLMENFKAPDFSISVNDFWKRWHISLTSWFRDYLYIPLGGNRKGTIRKYCNKLAVFLVSGLWHGADLSFVFWGGLHGLYVVAGEMLGPMRDRLGSILRIKRSSFAHKVFCTGRTFMLVTFAWIFFRADSMKTAVVIVKRIFSSFYYEGWTGGLMQQFNIHYAVTAAIAIIILLTIEFIERSQPLSKWLAGKPAAVKWPALYALMLCIAYVFITSNVKVSDASNFIYFQF